MTGTSRVCMTATTIPANASTGTIPLPLGLRVRGSAVVRVIAWGLQRHGKR
ncbi:hypothetical protein GCM10010515_38500 [Streptomyces fructofermentans]|uniref:Uncharacterized protein n=1 Tax=Streptomyces fructofermentans TaxID=152141 RepID=A0A918KM87_9ACTN|nr:hypothetical protein GCM10010515_38500 [Streptomyces fructofermentans]